MVRLTAERLAALPWTAHIGYQSTFPVRHGRGPEGERLCGLCGQVYLGADLSEPGALEVLGRSERCRGGPACPRFYHLRRRDVRWIQGYWVLTYLARRWDAEDEAQDRRRDAAGVTAPAAPLPAGRYGPCTAARQSPRPSAAPVVLHKPPPSAEQMAHYAATRPMRPAVKAAGFLPSPVVRPPPASTHPLFKAAPPSVLADRERSRPPAILAKPPPASIAAQGPCRPLAQPRWIRERLEAQVAESAAAAGTAAVEAATEPPPVTDAYDDLDSSVNFSSDDEQVVFEGAPEDTHPAGPSTAADERRRRIMAALIAADNARFSSEWVTTADNASDPASHSGHIDLLPPSAMDTMGGSRASGDA